jgi:serine protein kinase
MVIVKVPYTLSFNEEGRIYGKLVSSAPAFRDVHLDPHTLQVAAVFAVLTRLVKPEREGLDLGKKARSTRARASRASPSPRSSGCGSKAPTKA